MLVQQKMKGVPGFFSNVAKCQFHNILLLILDVFEDMGFRGIILQRVTETIS